MFRKVPFQFIQHDVDLTIKFQSVRIGLFLDGQHNGRATFHGIAHTDKHISISAFDGAAETHISNFLDQHRPLFTPDDRRIFNVFQRETLAADANKRFTRRANHDATASQHIGLLGGFRELLQSHLLSREFCR